MEKDSSHHKAVKLRVTSRNLRDEGVNSGDSVDEANQGEERSADSELSPGPTNETPSDQPKMSEHSGHKDKNVTQEKKGIRGRAHWEQPTFRPILDSDVELFEPASREPVRVSNAFTRMLISQFTLPLILLILSVALVAGIYYFLIQAEEKERMQYAQRTMLTDIEGGTLSQTPHNSSQQYLSSADSPLSLSGSSGGLAPAGEESCEEAVQLVQKFLKAQSLSGKLEMVLEPDRLEKLYLERFPASKIGAIPFRKVECLGRTGAGQRAIVVNVTLYNFTNRQFIVQRKQTDLFLEILRPEDLLE